MSRVRLTGVMFALFAAGVCTLLYRGTAPASLHSAPSTTGSANVISRTAPKDYAGLPLIFEINQGQFDPRVDFVSHGPGYTLFLRSNEVELSLAPLQAAKKLHANFASSPALMASTVRPTTTESPSIRMKLVQSNLHPVQAAAEAGPTRVNYFLGNDPTLWTSNVPTYAKVRYNNVYPGVDLVYYGNQTQLEYDFVVAAGVDPRVISLDFEAADNLELDDQGDLVFWRAGEHSLQIHKPYIYQEVGGVRREIAGGFVVSNHRVSFEIASYDSSRPLIIDPVFVYSTLLNGGDGEEGWAIAVDHEGNVYVVGDTNSDRFPLSKKPLQRSYGGSTDVFIAKLSADGTKLLYSTYLGGSGADVGYGIALDPEDNIYITGDTNSTDFPVTKTMQQTLAGESDVFVAKLSSDGSKLLYSTYVGGQNGERGNGIAVDSSGSAYVTGYTHSKDFPTVNPVQAAFAGGNADAFALKLDPSGSALIYSTYLGGGNDRPDIGTAIAVDSVGNAYVTGYTNSRDFPTVNPVQPFVGPTDVFVAKLNAAGSALLYSTHLGGSADDEAMGIAVDATGSVYITGETESPNFPTTPGALSRSCVSVPAHIPVGDICSGGDAFVSKLSPDGSRLIYSTYLNGSGFEVGRSIAVGSDGGAYVTGFTGSGDFSTLDPLQKAFGGGEYDAFVFKLNPNGSALTYSTYLGGRGNDGGYGVAVDSNGNAYVTGFTSSADFPVQRPLRNVSRKLSPDSRAVFVCKISSTSGSP